MNADLKARIESTVRAVVMCAVGMGWIRVKDQGMTDMLIYAGVNVALLVASLWWSAKSDNAIKETKP